MNRICIDIGANGGIVHEDNAGKVTAYKMPKTDEAKLHRICDIVHTLQAEDVQVTIERVGGYIGQRNTGSSMFRFGEGYGFLKGVVLSLGLNLRLVTPQTWQKALDLGGKGKLSTTQWKNRLKARAQQEFPDVKVTLWSADALLILLYARTVSCSTLFENAPS